jgi:hypothetical protein
MGGWRLKQGFAAVVVEPARAPAKKTDRGECCVDSLKAGTVG